MLHHRIIGSGRPLIILHGVTLDHRYMVEAVEPAFAGLDGWRRIYVDLPGHGQSPAQDEIASMDDKLAVVSEAVTALVGEERFGVIGYSRGSYLARGLVHQSPDQIAGAALITPGGNPSADPARLPAHQILQPDPALRADLAEAELWGFDHISVVQSRKIVEQKRRTIAPARPLFDEAQEARVFAKFDFSFHAEMEARDYDGPSLIIAGRQDSISGYLDAMDLSARYTRSTLAVLDTGGHGLAFERPDLFNSLLADWLDRLALAF